MRYSHLEILVEERSMQTLLKALIPKIVHDVTFKVYPFDGKRDLLRNLEARLRGYARMFETWTDAAVVVLVDEDRSDCEELKMKLEAAAKNAGLGTLSCPRGGQFRVLNRIAVEELEAWFFGDPNAVMKAYPRVQRRAFSSRALHHPDAIGGGTWEALERLLNKHNYHLGGLRKIECAADIGLHMDVANNTSTSFKNFVLGVHTLVQGKRN
jgi:Domain of unknown function (DUF4276)